MKSIKILLIATLSIFITYANAGLVQGPAGFPVSGLGDTFLERNGTASLVLRDNQPTINNSTVALSLYRRFSDINNMCRLRLGYLSNGFELEQRNRNGQSACSNVTLSSYNYNQSAGGAPNGIVYLTVGSGTENNYKGVMLAELGSGPYFAPITDDTITLGTASQTFSSIHLKKTIATVAGNITMNGPAGRVIVAAGGSTITVTNNKVTANSIILATVATNDGTAYVKNVVASAGSFVITLGASATADTAINFLVVGS
jgi:hypothetical protein